MSYACKVDHLLDKLLSLDIVQTVDTGNTVTIRVSLKSLLHRSILNSMIDNSACWWKYPTRRKGHVQSRQDQLPPEHHGFSAQGSRRPQWARPWPRRHMSGPVWHRQRREREQQREPTSNGKILLATAQPRENAPKQLQSSIEMP